MVDISMANIYIQAVLKFLALAVVGVIAWKAVPPVLKMITVPKPIASKIGVYLLVAGVLAGAYNGYSTATTGSSWFALPTLGGQAAFQPAPVTSGGTTIQQIMTASPNITVRTLDKYNTGTVVTTQNRWRPLGVSSWNDLGGGASITSIPPGSKFTLITGVDSDDESAEPYGAIIEHTAEYLYDYDLPSPVANDALATDLSVYFQNEIGQVNTNMTLGAGDVKSLKITWVGSYEEDFGNSYCGDKNVMVVKYNQTDIDSVRLASIDGSDLSSATVPVIHNDSTGYIDKAYYFPVLKSSGEYPFKAIVDVDDTLNPSTNTTTGGAGVPVFNELTFSLFDVGLFYDNNEDTYKCGVEDENNAEIGAVAADWLFVSYS